MKVLVAIVLAAVFGYALANPNLASAQAQSGPPSTSSTSATKDDLPPKLSEKLNHVTKGGKHHQDAEEASKTEQGRAAAAPEPNSYMKTRATDPDKHRD
ncbi:MAG TPA: hypothetical protein VLV50_00535 [Stellaceae bacterium]|nr:hypothetical protein [Stellaceae bacterium]